MDVYRWSLGSIDTRDTEKGQASCQEEKTHEWECDQTEPSTTLGIDQDLFRVKSTYMYPGLDTCQLPCQENGWSTEKKQ